MAIFGSGQFGGKKFFVQDFHNAYRFRPHVNPVRQKFQGYVNFVLNREFFGTLYGEPESKNEFRTTISSLVKTADLPSVNFQTEIKNSFNRKNIKLVGREYNPVNMTVFDTVGNEWITVLMKYFAYHFMDPRNMETGSGSQRRDIGGSNAGKSFGGTEMVGDFGPSETDSQTAKFSGAFDSNSDGLNTQRTSNFFERIDYILYHGSKGIQYSLINPYLVRFTPAPLDYADSNAFEFALEFQYEKFTVHSVSNFGLSEEDLDRFDPTAEKFEGPAHTRTAAEKSQLETGTLRTENLDFLTPEDNSLLLNRSTQTHALAPETSDPAEPGEGEDADETKSGNAAPDGGEVTNAQENDKAGSGGQNQTPASTALETVYGDAATIGGGSGAGGDDNNWFGDLLDATLGAAISGGDVKDAALGAIGQSAIRYLGNNPLTTEDVKSSVSGLFGKNDEDKADTPAPAQDTPTRGIGGGFF